VTDFPEPTAPPASRAETALLAALFAAALAWNLGTGFIGARHALSDSFGFRQTQTALSTWALLEGGPWLAYETPVLGPPWSVPMEFPLYQWLVALAVKALGLPLDLAGRVVARAFLYSALPLLWLLLAELCVRPAHRLVFLALLLANPYYAFWSRTFLMETAALVFGVGYLAFALRFASRGSSVDGTLAALAGSLCALVKSTTFPGFFGVAALAVSSREIERSRTQKAQPLIAGDGPPGPIVNAAVLALPLLAAVTWSLYADSLKSRNPLAGDLGSGRVLVEWLFHPGPDGWSAAWSRLRAMVAELAGGSLLLGLAAAAVFATGRRRAAFTVCLLAFVSVYAVFLRFHVVHLYYPCANGLFLVGAMGFGVLALFEAKGRGALLAWPLLVSALGVGVRTYHAEFERVQRRDAYAGPNATVRLARGLAGLTSARDVILGFGLDWSPEVPFYARRRALMWPGHVAPAAAALEQALDRLRSEHVGAVFVCREGSLLPESFYVLRRRLALAAEPRLRVGDCEAFTPSLAPRLGG
jgi:hypothetical protein